LGVKTAFIKKGSQRQNAYIESFNGKLRDELLNREIFDTVQEAQVPLRRWRDDYNHLRPHSSPGYRSPSEARAAKAQRNDERQARADDRLYHRFTTAGPLAARQGESTCTCAGRLPGARCAMLDIPRATCYNTGVRKLMRASLR